MKVLIINKFLKVVGGTETYVFSIAKGLREYGSEVQFFGMYDDDNVESNQVGSYTAPFDFHTRKLKRFLYPFSIVYSVSARRKIRLVLNDFNPDVVHFNLFNFQITPSVIYEILAWAKARKRKVKLVFTAHDYKLICPNSILTIPSSMETCEKCTGGKYTHCILNRCIHNSFAMSMVGTFEAYLYAWLKTYRHFDTIICPTSFMADKLSCSQILCNKLVVRYNPVDEQKEVSSTHVSETWIEALVQDEHRKYILYFGRYSEEKGLRTLIDVCKQLPDVEFRFAGRGRLAHLLDDIPNITDLGFLSGEALRKTILDARAVVVPSQCYENGSLSGLEAQLLGTPLIGARIGGIPERTADNKTGLLFESGNAEELKNQILRICNDDLLHKELSENCRRLPNFIECETVSSYCRWLLEEAYV